MCHVPVCPAVPVHKQASTSTSTSTMYTCARSSHVMCVFLSYLYVEFEDRGRIHVYFFCIKAYRVWSVFERFTRTLNIH